jgi:hypothetical protein
MVQEIKNISDIYLSLFNENKFNISKFINFNMDDNDSFVEYYNINLRLIKLLAEDSNSILEINCFYNLSSIGLLAGTVKTGTAKKIIKISNNINLSYYELINYINNVELLLYEDFNISLNQLNVDFLYINNFHNDKNYSLYNKIFDNVEVKKYIMIDGVDEYFNDKLKTLIRKNNWKIYAIKKDNFNFLILKRI